MAKPATLDSYSDQHTFDCERVLVTLLRGLGPWKDSVYPIGGLTPRYLVPARPPAVPAHAGTMDVDIMIDLQILADTQAYQTLEENFKKLGFERAVNDKQQKLSWRWQTKTEHGAVMVLELLADAPDIAGGKVQALPTDGTIATTLRHIDWILRFHDVLLRALLASGCRLQARLERRSRWFEVQRDGETVRLSFAEEYDKVPAGKSRASSSAWSLGTNEHSYRPRDTYKLKVERDIGGLKQWVGTAAELETRLPEIARDILGLLRAQGAQRKIVDAEREAQRLRDEQRAAERQAWFAAQQALAQRKATRKAQVDRAIAAAKALDEYAAVGRLLATLEHGIEPGSLEPGVRSWIELVRSELADPVDTLTTAIRKEAAGEDRPLWWHDSGPNSTAQ